MSREDFEVAYLRTAQAQGFLMNDTPASIAKLRTSDDAYGERSYLNGCWAGWKMVSAALDAEALAHQFTVTQYKREADTVALADKRLFAANAALDAVLELATDNSALGESQDSQILRERIVLRLASHGVHPRGVRCTGTNCTSNGHTPHSAECIAQHDATVAGANDD